MCFTQCKHCTLCHTYVPQVTYNTADHNVLILYPIVADNDFPRSEVLPSRVWLWLHKQVRYKVPSLTLAALAGRWCKLNVCRGGSKAVMCLQCMCWFESVVLHVQCMFWFWFEFVAMKRVTGTHRGCLGVQCMGHVQFHLWIHCQIVVIFCQQLHNAQCLLFLSQWHYMHAQYMLC